MDRESKAALSRGQAYEAASRLLHMWKQMGTQRFGADRAARLTQLIRENCYHGDELLPSAENRLRLEFIHSEKAGETRDLYGSFASHLPVWCRLPHTTHPR